MTKNSKKTLSAIGVVFAITIVTYVLVDDAEFINWYFSIPAVGSLVSALFVLIKDYLAYERELLLQDRKNQFVVGASSHMANVAFDKHAEFAEKYVKEAQQALRTLFREGPTKDLLPHAAKLHSIQDEYVVWLTVSIEEQIDKFESAIRQIGAAAHLERQIHDTPGREERVAAMYKTFAEVVGAKTMGSDQWNGEKLSEDRAVSMLIRRLRAVLGSEELTLLRGAIMQKAVQDSAV